MYNPVAFSIVLACGIIGIPIMAKVEPDNLRWYIPYIVVIELINALIFLRF